MNNISKNSNVSLEIIKQLYGSLSENEKQEFLNSLKEAQEQKKVLLSKNITNCIHCGSTDFTKNGKKDGRQRYICKDCHRTFAPTNKTIFFSSKKGIEVWQKYIECFLEKYSLDKCAKICKISRQTAFLWRHKLLDALQKMMSEVKLDGIVEADETFFSTSYKGNHKKGFRLPRLARHRGTPASKRGLSKEQVCVSCAIDLSGKSIAKISNLGKPSLNSLQKVFNDKIQKDSVFITDNLRSYIKLAYDMGLTHIRIPRKKHSLGAFNIQMINSYHSRLKAMTTYNFRGVSSKYLNNYIVYHNFVNFAKDSNKDDVLLNFTINTNSTTKIMTMSNRPALPLVA